MNSLTFSLIILATSMAAGLLGSLTGLGGGAIIVAILVLFFRVDLDYAIGSSLIAVVATSSGAAAAFIREGYTNVRLAMILEMATVAGAITGAWLSQHTPNAIIAVVFGIVLLWTAWSSTHPPPPRGPDDTPDAFSARLRLDGTCPTPQGPRHYRVHQVPAGFSIMFGAGVLSALLGIGSGVVKVFAMDRLMRLPFKVSTTTSNFMIGVTAAASSGVYLHRGQIDPVLTAPVALGALGGAFLGARLLPRMKVKTLRVIFAIIVSLLGLQMMYKGVVGAL